MVYSTVRSFVNKSRTNMKHSVNMLCVTVVLGAVGLVAPKAGYAGEAAVEAATASSSGGGVYTISATVRHGDTGWEHYADAFRVEAPDGTVLGTRILYHPHVDEQPFTRSLGGVVIPAGIKTVLVRAKDKVHGWAKDAYALSLP